MFLALAGGFLSTVPPGKSNTGSYLCTTVRVLGGSGSGCDRVVLGAGQLWTGQTPLCCLRPLHVLSTLASLGFPTAWLPQRSQSAYMVAEVFTEDIPVVQTEVTWFFLPNLGTHEVFFFFFFFWSSCIYVVGHRLSLASVLGLSFPSGCGILVP